MSGEIRPPRGAERLWCWGLGIVTILGALLLILAQVAYAQAEPVEPTLIPRLLVSPWWFGGVSLTGFGSIIALAVHWGRSTGELNQHRKELDQMWQSMKELADGRVGPTEVERMEVRLGDRLDRIEERFEARNAELRRDFDNQMRNLFSKLDLERRSTPRTGRTDG